MGSEDSYLYGSCKFVPLMNYFYINNKEKEQKINFTCRNKHSTNMDLNNFQEYNKKQEKREKYDNYIC